MNDQWSVNLKSYILHYTYRMIFFLATSLTSTILIAERDEGVWDRSIVAGV